MGFQQNKQQFVQKFDGEMYLRPAYALPDGAYSALKNMVYVPEGLRTRRGMTRYNTTAAAATSCQSILQFLRESHGVTENRLLLHCTNGTFYLSSSSPPNTGSFTSLYAGDSDADPAVGDTLLDQLVIGTGKETLTWKGLSPLPTTVLFYDDTLGGYDNKYDELLDGEIDLSSMTTAAKLYIGTNVAYMEGLTITVSSANSNSASLSVKVRTASGWTTVNNLSDGTASGGVTLALSGNVTFDSTTSAVPWIVNGVMLFWLELSVSADLDSDVKLSGITMDLPMQPAHNLWCGTWEWPAAAGIFDSSADTWTWWSSFVTNAAVDSYMQLGGTTTGDYIYIKTPWPASAIRFGVHPENYNTADAEVSAIQTWTPNGWTSVGTFEDTTMDATTPQSSFSTDGWLSWDASTLDPRMTIVSGDPFPGYWYRVSVDATLSSDVRIWAVSYMPYMGNLDGAKFATRWRDRMTLGGFADEPNMLWVSTPARPTGFNGPESVKMYFGDSTPLVNAVRFFNDLVVFKHREIWILQGYAKENMGVLQLETTEGAVGSKAVAAGKLWISDPDSGVERFRHVIYFLSANGPRMLLGDKVIPFGGPQVQALFDPEEDDSINQTKLSASQLFYDYANDRLHVLIATGSSTTLNKELVFDAKARKWSVFERVEDLQTGASVVGSSRQSLIYGGDADGFVYRLANGMYDEAQNGTATAISWQVVTNDIKPFGQFVESEYRTLGLVTKSTTDGGTINIRVYPDGRTTGQTLSEQMSSSVSGADTALNIWNLPVPESEAKHTMRIEFYGDVNGEQVVLLSYGLLIVPLRYMIPDEFGRNI